jgi:hypothetical protein
MREFVLGYILGASAKSSAPLRGRVVAIIVLVLMAFAGVIYMMMPLISPETVPASVDQCGGTEIMVAMCKLRGVASLIGGILVGLVAAVVAGWVVLAGIGSGKK